MQTRRDFLVTTAKAGVVTASLGAVGCGGGSGASSDGQVIKTSFRGADLSGATTTPAPGAVFIGKATTFVLSFPFGDPPPEFTIFLRRFLEPIGGENFDTPSQKVSVEQIDSRSWRISRRDGFDLDGNAVYFVELTAPGGLLERFVFITSSNRSRDVLFTPNSGGNISNINIAPAPGSYGLSKGIGNSGFLITWSNSFPPPNRFRVRLRRFKEPRGSDVGGDTEQQTEGQDQGNFQYVVRRRDRIDMDGQAAYYLEVDATEAGQGIYRAAYTTE